MKHPLFLLAMGLLPAVLLSAQGTFNASNNYTVPGASQKAFIVDHNNSPLTKASGRVQIINPADGSTLSPNGNAGVPLTLDGLFFINGLSVPGVPTGGTATIVVRAWDVTSGATWNVAMFRSSSSSGLTTVTSLGGGTTPAATFMANSNFVGLMIGVPEPTSIALGVFGLAGLGLVLRRTR